ncbi:LysR family transcriptional regulator [Clostridium vitabionis]|uniref:LysR family transcriptional regulator n=1 Tax=Clostridium vitabionis TaxID=2784388 RepID=UPI0022A7E66C|nr:LysR family transcriptional regulator [Clostridium vitabionis]
MNFFQLECFRMIEKKKSFTAAADELSLSQSALSKQISRLEDELGVRLFDRSRRNVKMTLAGQEFSAHAQKLCEDYEKMQQAIRWYRENGRIVIGVVESIGSSDLSETIGSFLNLFPRGDVDVEVRKATTWQLLDLLKDGQIDMAFVARIESAVLGTSNLDRCDLRGNERYTLRKDVYRAVVNPDHPFARQESLTWEQLAGEKLVILDKANSLNAMIRSMFASRNLEPDIVFECGDVSTLMSMVKAGFGISMFSTQVAASRGDLVSVEVRPALTRDLVLVVPKESAKGRSLASRFVRHTLEHFGSAETEREKK